MPPLPALLTRCLPAPAPETEFLPAALEIVETPPSPLGRTVLWSICLFVSAAIVWAVVGRLDMVATAQGKIIARGRTKAIQPEDMGSIHAIRVAEGQKVRAGDVLIEIDPTSNAADIQRYGGDLLQAQLDVIRLRVLAEGGDPAPLFAPYAAHEREIAATKRQLQAQQGERGGRLAAIDDEISRRQAEKAQAEARLLKAESALPLARERAAIRQRLVESQLGSRLTWLEAEQAAVELGKEREVLRHKVEETRAALRTLHSQRTQVQEEFRRSALEELSKAERRLAEAEGELAKARHKFARRTLTAPVDGVVQQLAVHTAGAVVVPAQPLMMIVPDDGEVEIEALIENKDVGFVAAGQPVEIKVETYTFTRYGLLHGTVRSVSTDAMADTSSQGNGAVADGLSQMARAGRLVYVAHITLEESGIDVDGRIMPLHPGMAVTAEIKTGTRRAIDYFLSPLRQWKHDAFRDR